MACCSTSSTCRRWRTAQAKRAINAPLLAALIRPWAPTRAYCEFVGARPREGPVGAFSFGRCRGVIEGTLGTLAVPIEMIAPAWWSRRGRCVRVESYDKDGRQQAGTLLLFPDDLPDFVVALAQAAAAIGFRVPVGAAPQPNGAALDRAPD